MLLANDKSLADFQAALLDLLVQPLPAEIMHERLRTAPEFQEYQAYIADFEPRMIEVAAELVKKWGRRHDEPEEIGHMPH
jgi:hypothetical protein